MSGLNIVLTPDAMPSPNANPSKVDGHDMVVLMMLRGFFGGCWIPPELLSREQFHFVYNGNSTVIDKLPPSRSFKVCRIQGIDQTLHTNFSWAYGLDHPLERCTGGTGRSERGVLHHKVGTLNRLCYMYGVRSDRAFVLFTSPILPRCRSGPHSPQMRCVRLGDVRR